MGIGAKLLKARLRATAGAQIQIAGLQETCLLDESWNADVAASLAKQGWRALTAPAVRTQAGGKSAGTALMVPTCLGVKKLDDQKKWDISPKTCGGRLVIAALQTRGLGWMQVFVCYFVCSEGLESLRNAALCETITEWVVKTASPSSS